MTYCDIGRYFFFIEVIIPRKLKVERNRYGRTVYSPVALAFGRLSNPNFNNV